MDELLKQAYSWSPNPKKANQVNEVNTTSAWYPNNPIYSSVARRGAREDVTVYFFHED